MRNPSSPPTITTKNKKSNNTNIGGSSNNNNIKTICCNKVELKRGPWTPEEDKVLANYIKREGEGRWRTLPKRAGLLRCGKSCRLRWMNYLRPSVKHGHIAPDEEDLILRLHRLLGNRWSLIAGRIPGRTDNEIKNYWNTHLTKKLVSQGIDPRTHKPLNLSPSINIPSSSSCSNFLPSKPPAMMISNHNNPCHDLIVNQGFQYHFGQQHHQPPVCNNKIPLPVPTDDVSAMGFMDNDDISINYYSDDVFISFLNSLINDDAFAAQQQQQLPTERNIPQSCDDPLGSITTGSAPQGYDDDLGVLWESSLVPASTFSENIDDHITKRIYDHHNQ